MLSLSCRSLIVVVVMLAIVDYGCWQADGSVLSLGPLDELAHLLTMLLVLWALGCRLDRPFAIAALLASVVIDIDHIPQYLGWHALTQGTPRPYTHSLLTILILLGGAALWRRCSQAIIGLAAGLAIHFFRDMTEPASGVSLLWPASYRSFSLPHWAYIAAMALVAAVCVARVSASRAPRRRRELARATGNG